MSDLDQKEQDHVRAALHYLRIQMGGLKPVAKALRAAPGPFQKVANGQTAVSASMALRIARLLDVPFDDLLLGRYKPGACPKCGHRPSYVSVYASDFVDEATVVEDAPHRTSDARLKLVKYRPRRAAVGFVTFTRQRTWRACDAAVAQRPR